MRAPPSGYYFFFYIKFLRLSITAALTNRNADILSTKEGLCDEWQQCTIIKIAQLERH